MYELSVKNDKGELLALTDNQNYIVYKVTGISPPQATINTSVNTTHDGSKINSARMENRNLVIYMAIEGDVEENRINLYRYFPVKKEVTIYFRHSRRNVYIEGTVEGIECDLFTNKEVAQISIICPKTYFKEVDYLVTMLSDIEALFEFPFAIEKEGIEFSAVTKNARKTIVNTGDAETGVIIRLFSAGTAVNPIIYDVKKRCHMKLNFTMQPSDEIVINTNVGEKSITLIRNGISSNAMGYMAVSSEWFILEVGENVYTFDCDSGSVEITFTTTILYCGV